MKRIALATAVAAALSVAALAEPIDALLVVQYRVPPASRKPLASLGGRLAMALSGDVFNIIDPSDAIGTNQNREQWGEGMPESSATRLAESLEARALVTAEVGEVGEVAIAGGRVLQPRMTLTLAAKRLPKGATVAAVTVPVSGDKTTREDLEANRDAVYAVLMERLVKQASADFLEECRRVAWNDGGGDAVEVAFGCNFPGADVAVDGVSLGTAGTVGEPPLRARVAPGLHNLTVSYPYTEPYKVLAKFQEGTTFMVVLKETGEGRRIRREDRHFDVLMGRIEESGATDDAVRTIRARGYGRYLESSHTRIEGIPTVLTVQDCQLPALGLDQGAEGEGISTGTRDLLGEAGSALGYEQHEQPRRDDGK